LETLQITAIVFQIDEWSKMLGNGGRIVRLSHYLCTAGKNKTNRKIGNNGFFFNSFFPSYSCSPTPVYLKKKRYVIVVVLV
jgi:hypothetical protein